MTSSQRKPAKGSRSWRAQLAYKDDIQRKALLAIRWQDGAENTPELEDFEFMAEWGAYAVKYFDDQGEVWWGFFSQAGCNLSAKGLDR